MTGFNRTSISYPSIIAIKLSGGEDQSNQEGKDGPNKKKKRKERGEKKKRRRRRRGEGEEEKEKRRRRKKRTTLALTKSPNLKQSPILILSLSVNLISANLMTPVKSSLDSGTGLLFDI
jgi:hypothetical protein